MLGDDLDDHLEIGLPGPRLQRVEAGLRQRLIVLGVAQLCPVELPRRLDPQRCAAVFDIAPDDRSGFPALDGAKSSEQQIVERIKALAESPVFTSHEDAVDLGVERRDVINRAALYGVDSHSGLLERRAPPLSGKAHIGARVAPGQEKLNPVAFRTEPGIAVDFRADAGDRASLGVLPEGEGAV